MFFESSYLISYLVRTQSDCCICYLDKPLVSVFKCGHTDMCIDCANKWKSSCPICRNNELIVPEIRPPLPQTYNHINNLNRPVSPITQTLLRPTPVITNPSHRPMPTSSPTTINRVNQISISNSFF